MTSISTYQISSISCNRKSPFPPLPPFPIRKHAGFPSEKISNLSALGFWVIWKSRWEHGMCMMCGQSAKNQHVPRPMFPLSQASNMQQQQDYSANGNSIQHEQEQESIGMCVREIAKAWVFSLSNHSSPGTGRACFSQNGTHQPLQQYPAKICEDSCKSRFNHPNKISTIHIQVPFVTCSGWSIFLDLPKPGRWCFPSPSSLPGFSRLLCSWAWHLRWRMGGLVPQSWTQTVRMPWDLGSVILRIYGIKISRSSRKHRLKLQEFLSTWPFWNWSSSNKYLSWEAWQLL